MKCEGTIVNLLVMIFLYLNEDFIFIKNLKFLILIFKEKFN